MNENYVFFQSVTQAGILGKKKSRVLPSGVEPKTFQLLASQPVIRRC